MSSVSPRVIPEEARSRLRILLVAKHARWAGGLHPEDGNHALYHVETREILKGLGLHLELADRYETLFERPDVDFVFPLLNRGGFLNSEMLLPLLCTRARLPFLGASPILRGLADDKHLAKLCAAARGVPTAPWAIYRRGAPVEEGSLPLGAAEVTGSADTPTPVTPAKAGVQTGAGLDPGLRRGDEQGGETAAGANENKGPDEAPETVEARGGARK